MRYLKAAFGEAYGDHVSIHSVLCPPFTSSKMDAMKAFFVDSDLFPESMLKDTALVGAGTLPADHEMPMRTMSTNDFYAQSMDIVNPVKHWALTELSNYVATTDYAFRIEQSDLMKMHMRSITQEPALSIFRNACCTPGIRKLYVDVAGNFSACERIGNAPFIGNLNEGLSLETINQKYMQEYDQGSLHLCNQCWAMHLCTICYARCYDEKGLNEKKKAESCIVARSEALHNLIEYYQLMEENQEVINTLDRIYTAYA